MRIIHTSDWHLGQSFYTKSRAREHQAFLDWLVCQVEQHQVDAVIVAGDIYDTGTPPSYARELFNHFVVALQALQPNGCELIVMAGNHDAVATLNESRALLACMHTRIIAGVGAANSVENQVVVLKERNGKPGAILCAIPFLRPRDMLLSHAGQSAPDKQRALMDAIAGHYQALYAQALTLRAQLPGSLPIIASGHLTTVGASTTDSVRDIYIGSLEAFPAQLFPPANYIALGHIHRPQCVAGQDHIRYCGAPIALSFDEAGQPKQVNLVSFDDNNIPNTVPLLVPETQALRLLKGSLTEIEAGLQAFSHSPPGPPAWLDIEVITDAYLNDIQQQIQRMAADLPVEIVLLRRNREQRLLTLAQQHHETLTELSTAEVFERRLALITQPESEQLSRIRILYQQVADDVASAQSAPGDLH